MDHGVDDEKFKKLVAIVRLAVPFTGMIISTRETMEMRKELIKIGISQISGGSSVDVGGYSARERNEPQFILSDSRVINQTAHCGINQYDSKKYHTDNEYYIHINPNITQRL